MSLRSVFKSLNPWGAKAVNTLDSSPKKTTERPQSAHSNDSRETPRAKRQKTSRDTEVIPRGSQESIEEFPSQPIQSRGHTYSPSISPSPISSHVPMWNSHAMAEYQGRGNRRHRHRSLGSNKSQSSAEDVPSAFGQKYTAPDNQEQTRSKVQSDAADLEILRNISAHLQPAQPKGKKRLKQESHEDDELAMGHTPNDSKKRQPGPSVSRRGDIVPTQFPRKAANGREDCQSLGDSERFTVSAAVCYRNYYYVAGEKGGTDACYMQAHHDKPQAELRAFTQDGNPHGTQQWLKLTNKIKALHFHPSSSLIKVTQPTDTSLDIGKLLVIKFATPQDASSVARWATRVLKLHAIYDKALGEINRDTPWSSAGIVAGAGSPNAQPPDAGKARGTSASITPSQVSPSNKPRTTIRGSMQVSEPATPQPVATYGRRSLRSTHGSTTDATSAPIDVDLSLSPETPPPPRWSLQNRSWLEDWKTPLQFGRVQVTKDDIPRLDEGQYLNDSIIEFGLKYLFEKFTDKHPDLSKRVYMHNSFFYTSLTGDGGNQFKYENVKRWTAKVDLLSYDYIVVPINQHFHWWVAIICNPGKLDPAVRQTAKEAEATIPIDVEMTDAPKLVTSDVVDKATDGKPGFRPSASTQPKQRKPAYSLDDPRIILLDSLGSSHGPAVKNLRRYLVEEFEDKRGRRLEQGDWPTRLGMKATNIPQQSNLTDCGVYVLGYVQEFVKDPDTFVKALLSKEPHEWALSAPLLRTLWRDTIFYEKSMTRTEPGRQQNAGMIYPMSAERMTKLFAQSAKLSTSPSRDSAVGRREESRHAAVPEPLRPVGMAGEPAQGRIGSPVEAPKPAKTAKEPAGRMIPTEGVQEVTKPMDLVVNTPLIPSIEDSIEDSPTPEPPQITDLTTLVEPGFSKHVPKLKERPASKLGTSPTRQSSHAEDDEVMLVPLGRPDSTLFTARISSSPAEAKKAVDTSVQELDAKSFYNKSATPPGHTKNAKPRQPTRQVALMSQSSPAQAPNPKRADAGSTSTGTSKRPHTGSTPTGVSRPKRPGASSPPTTGSQSRYFNGTPSPGRRQRVATNVGAAYTSVGFAPTREATVEQNLAAVKHHEPINIDDSD
ncbi:hypothetical protein QC762_208980 [Podospora pseudocomata]|uniref:Ubiquitin-like protease family profile domain-containing protein n=1 Tax=Podospora pseudocomata TaxID=2093779 RepID=A0ABR0GMI0_9PEZI|nr:hypothetical protein QC762_208980 [Podospora pseudocomata]